MPRPAPSPFAVLAALSTLCFSAVAAAQDTDVFPTLGRIVALDDAFAECVDSDAPIEVLGSGFTWCEGPAWDAEKNRLLFSEIPSNTVRVWEPRKAVRVFLDPAGYTGLADYGNEPGSNGLVVTADRRLLSCEHGDRRVSAMPLDEQGGKITLADRFEGQRLNSPNDLCVHSNGTIYFTDPPYGLPGGFESPLRELDFCGVYRLTPPTKSGRGTLSLVTKEMPRPNGIALSPDEKTLYVADSGAKHWMKFPVAADGSTGEGTMFFDASKEPGKGSADGLKVDAEGRVWATGPGGVWVFDPSGKPLGRIETGEHCSNVAFGGPDGRDLFITSDMYLCRVKTKTKPAAK
ncbi:SMP-30/gluconolactonase/LRE family protein [Alienimonas californiensis]|uniref:Gluconolactonase n=1 Tax=Alienimonas californiensis TaxID=2527989 RepID=A0A517P4H1_9PLAN|nr:SMP-30/gluconolactonase/LRE family protein [Alienimonas californiensis]QDT14288.1 Gluconolactonase precursor [Alienimonas californiensis]